MFGSSMCYGGMSERKDARDGLCEIGSGGPL